MRTAVCVLSRYYNETWIAFLQTFTHYDVFFVVDDMTTLYESPVQKVHVLQIPESTCREANYYHSSTASNLKDIVAWDKALYYFNRINTQYDHVWFLEEDVFLFSEDVLRNIDHTYASSDLLSAFHEINETGDIHQGWNHWVNVIHRIGTPWAHSLISASRLSRRLLDRIDDYIRDRPLLFIEALFNTLALQNQYQVDTPAELQTTITYNTVWDREKVDTTKIYHPFKKIEDHVYIRENSQKKIASYTNMKIIAPMFIPPEKKGYTIYTKEKCVFCNKVKTLLEKEGYRTIPCDEYLSENREAFLSFIETRAGRPYRTFPMVFLNGIFVGGFTETKKHMDAFPLLKQEYAF